jgi:hypothetical protein
VETKPPSEQQGLVPIRPERKGADRLANGTGGKTTQGWTVGKIQERLLHGRDETGDQPGHVRLHP